MVLRLLGDPAGVARVHLAADRILHEAMQHERGDLEEGIDVRGSGVGDQEHVGLLDLLIPADRRSVEPEPVDETVLGQLGDRYREVLHESR